MTRFPWLILVALFAACSDTPQPPTVDVTGIWTGTWHGEGNAEHGFLVIDLRQQTDGELTGGVYIRYDLPSLQNVGVDVDGRVEGSSVTFTMQSSDNPHTFRGEVTADAASGALEYRGLTGSWDARRLPTSVLQVEDSFDTSMRLPRAMTMVDKELWATDAATFYRVDPATHKVTTVSPGPDSPSCQSGLAHDGTDLLCTGGSPKIHRMDLSLKEVGGIELDDKTWPELLAYDGTQLWTTQGGDYSLRRVDLSGKVLQTFSVKASVDDMTWLGGHLYLLLFTPRAVLKLDAAAKIVAGYQFPAEVIQRTEEEVPVSDGIAGHGQSLWVSVQRMSTGPGPSSSTRLYRFKLP